MKKKMTVLAVLLLAVVTTTYSVSGTYAKYTSTFDGSTDSARVAKWAFSINDTDMTTASNAFKFDLFKTVKDTDGSDETDVKVGAGEEVIIAPGTQGSFQIVLANNSEVNAQYTVDYEVTKTADIPVEFSIDGGQSWTTELADVTATDIAMMNANGSTTTINIQWRWAFEGANSENYKSGSAKEQTDDTDTALGVKTTADTISVDANITVTQVD